MRSDRWMQNKYIFMNKGQQCIMFVGHKQEDPKWEKGINVQNEEKFLNSPMATVVQKEERIKIKLQKINTNCLHLIVLNAGFIFCIIIIK
jgi:hypothetical protein